MLLKKLFRIFLGMQFALGIGLTILTISLFLNQRELSKSQRVHFQSYLLADELRQSSDDLTRLARTYVATGNKEFERQYWAVLDIRNGRLPRPVDYNRIYWDFVSQARQKPRPDGAAISLHELMLREGFTEAEFEKLALAQKNSDELVEIERVAMNAVKGLFADGAGNFTVKKEPARSLAIRLMNDEAYHKSKFNIMRPIDEFYSMFAERTAGSVAKYERRSMMLLQSLGVLIIVIMGMFVFSFVTIQRQITERMSAEEVLRETKSILQAAMDNSQVGIAIADAPSGVLRYVNDAGLLIRGSDRQRVVNGVGIDQYVSKWQLLDFDGRPLTKEEVPLARAIMFGETCSREFIIHRADNDDRVVFANASPIKNAQGKVVAGVVVFMDTTEKKKAEEALMKLTEAKSKFTSMVSHELRSPLAVIKGALSIALDGLVGDVNHEQRDILATAKENADRLGRLINNVLDFQKMESGKMEYDIQENDIHEIVQEIYRSMVVLSKRKGLDLSVELGENVPKLKFDRDKMIQVLTNLMSNAIKQTEGGGIRIDTKNENNAVHIRVQDTGRGIRAEDMGRLFRPFEQVEGMSGGSKGGTGLGLAISKEIILAHGGKIWAESAVGKGSTFHFTLPL